MKKHGILIIAHSNLHVVKTAMSMLDDERFAMYLLVDIKSKYRPEEFVPELKKSSCHILEQRNMNWSGYSYTEGEFALLEEALKDGEIEFFHILQGADLPLKTPEEICTYFEKNKSKNFIKFCDDNAVMMLKRNECKHFLLDNRLYRKCKLLRIMNRLFTEIQYLFIDKKRSYVFHSALYSLSREFVEYFLEHKSEIKRKYRWAYCPEESIVGTLIINSKYVEGLESQIDTRCIDWKRADGTSPHTYTMMDRDFLAEAIKKKDYIFARKFSDQIDIDIVEFVRKMVISNCKEEETHY